MMDVLMWEPLFALTLDIAFDRYQEVGQTPLGWRAVFPINGGNFDGPRMKGNVMPDGADWVVRRADGTTSIDVRLMLKTHDEAMIAMQYSGIISIAPVAAKRFRSFEPVDYEETYVRTTPRFETADPRYDWLNRVIAVANGGSPRSQPTYQVFAIL